MAWLVRLGSVLPHHIVVHECLGPEERETAGRAHDTANHVLCSLLQPMANGVFEQLIPDHWARANGVNATACRSQVLVLLHEIHQQCDSRWLEVDVSVKGEQVRVLRQDLLAVHRNGQLHELVTQQVVHVHALGPALLVPNQRLVLHVDNHLGLAGQRVDQTAAIGRWHLLGRPQPDVGLMHVGAGHVHAGHKVPHELIHLHPVVAHVRQLEGVVKEDVRLELVVVGIHHLEILLGNAARALVLVHAEQRLHHLHHLALGLVPHGGAGVDARDTVAGLGLGVGRLAGLGVDGDGLVVLGNVVVIHSHTICVRQCGVILETCRQYGTMPKYLKIDFAL